MKTKLKKPWLDHRGREYSMEKLKEISKSWDKKIWLSYANSLEGGREGKNLSTEEFKKFAEQQTESFFKNIPNSITSLKTRKKIFKAISLLSERQRQVIEMIFFSGKTIEQTARILEISGQAVGQYKLTALEKLKNLLSKDLDNLASYIRVNDLKSEDETSKNEVLEVMNAEISRTEMSRRNFYGDD